MERAFRHFHPLSDTDITEIWSSALFAVDASSLLNLYTFSPSGRDELFRSLRTLKTQGRLWLPHQVGQEFHRHRPYVARNSKQAIQQTKQSLTEFLKNFRKIVKVHDDAKDLLSAIETAQNQLDDYVSKHSATGKHNPTPSADSVLKELEEIFDQAEMVGQPFDKERLAAVYAEGRHRFAAAIPPGYKDDEKPEPWRYGDLIVWKQLIERAKAVQRPAILISDDTKDDWMFKIDGNKSLIPHPLLREEFQQETGQVFWLYTTEEFLRQAKERGLSPVSDDVIDEARESRGDLPSLHTELPAPLYGQHPGMARALANLNSWTSLPDSAYFNAQAALDRLYESPSRRIATGGQLPGFADLEGTLGIIPQKGLGFAGLSMGNSSEPSSHEEDGDLSDTDNDPDSARGRATPGESPNDTDGETEEQ